MARLAPTACLALLLLAAPHALADPFLREERRDYYGAFIAFAVYNCETHVDFGAECFVLDGSESRFDLRLHDATGRPTPVFYGFDDGPSSGTLCDGADDLPVPQGARHLWIVVLGAPWAGVSCPGALGGTAGEMVVTFQ